MEQGRDSARIEVAAVACGQRGSGLRILLALLVAITIACGLAVGETVSLAPAYADASGGY